MIDALTALQVEEHADLTTRQLIEEFEKIGPKAARAWLPGTKSHSMRSGAPYGVGLALRSRRANHCQKNVSELANRCQTTVT